MTDDVFLVSKRAREDTLNQPPLEEESCPVCLRGGFGPRHMPSLKCENGGKYAHCSCGPCFGR